jgi:peptide deformylase
MSLRPILRYGARELAIPSAPLSRIDGDTAALAHDMLETMYAAPGVGLAAPQIGVNIRLIVIDVTGGRDPSQVVVMANPEMLEQEGEQREEEGCLSVPGFGGVVARARRTLVKGVGLDGKEFTREGTGLLARAFCHEIDHLNGKLFVERLGLLKRDLIVRKIKKKMREGDWTPYPAE